MLLLLLLQEISQVEKTEICNVLIMIHTIKKRKEKKIIDFFFKTVHYQKNSISSSSTITSMATSSRSNLAWNLSNWWVESMGAMPFTMVFTLSERFHINSHRVTIRSAASECNLSFRSRISSMGSSTDSW